MNKRHVLMNEAGEGSAGGGGDALAALGAAAPATPPVTPPVVPATPPAWTESLDDDGKKFVETRGYKSPAEALAALRETAAPESPDGYQLPVPEGGDAELAKTASAWFHKAGIGAKQAAAFTAEWNAFAAEQQKAWEAEDAQAAKDAEARNQREDGELKREWGETAAAQMELAKRAFTTYAPGTTPEEKAKIVQVLQREVGYKATMKMFAAIGAHLDEDRAHGLGGAGSANPTIAAATRLYDKSSMNP